MKIRILSNGNHYQILEEFVRYDIIIYQGKVVNNLVAPVVDPLINMANKVTDTIQTIEEQAMEIYNKVESTVQEAYNQGMGYYNQAVNIYNNTLGVISIISPEAAQLIDSKARSEINGMVSNLASSMGFEIAGLSGIGSMLGSFSTGYSKHYDVNTIKQRIGLKINGLTIDNTYVVTYEEIYDYRGTYFPVRIFGLSLPVSLFGQIVGTNTNTDVAVDIAYGFQTRDGQDVGGTSSNDISRFNVYKNLNSYIGKLSYPRAKETKKEIKHDTDNVGTVSKYVALAVLPNEVMRKNTNKKLTNGYYKDVNLTTLIVEGFYKYFGETSTEFALAPLHNDTTITKYLKTMTFPDLLKYLQKQYNIYNGGPNVFVDDRVYVVNKNGPVELETPETWSYEIVIKEDSLPKMNEIYETNDASKRARIVLNKENFQQITYNVNKKINQNIYNQGGMGSLSGTDGIAAIETITAVNHNKATLPQLEDEYEIHSLLLNNFPCVFNIGDKVTLKTGKLLFEGTVFKWTAKFVNRERSIGLMIITKKKDFATGDYLGGSFSFLDSNAILSSIKIVLIQL